MEHVVRLREIAHQCGKSGLEATPYIVSGHLGYSAETGLLGGRHKTYRLAEVSRHYPL